MSCRTGYSWCVCQMSDDNKTTDLTYWIWCSLMFENCWLTEEIAIPHFHIITMSLHLYLHVRRTHINRFKLSCLGNWEFIDVRNRFFILHQEMSLLKYNVKKRKYQPVLSNPQLLWPTFANALLQILKGVGKFLLAFFCLFWWWWFLHHLFFSKGLLLILNSGYLWVQFFLLNVRQDNCFLTFWGTLWRDGNIFFESLVASSIDIQLVLRWCRCLWFFGWRRR